MERWPTVRAPAPTYRCSFPSNGTTAPVERSSVQRLFFTFHRGVVRGYQPPLRGPGASQGCCSFGPRIVQVVRRQSAHFRAQPIAGNYRFPAGVGRCQQRPAFNYRDMPARMPSRQARMPTPRGAPTVPIPSQLPVPEKRRPLTPKVLWFPESNSVQRPPNLASPGRHWSG